MCVTDKEDIIMEDILRKLYDSSTTRKPSDPNYLRAKHHASDLSDKLIEKLEQLGVKDANDLITAWTDAWFTFTNEELILSFKKGIGVGFQLSNQLHDEEQ